MIYCKNCKYSAYKHLVKDLYKMICKKCYIYSDCLQPLNNCEKYKRKWWKFWVKEED